MDLLILGAGEYGNVIKDIAKNTYQKIDFLDDNSNKAIGTLEEYEKYISYKMLLLQLEPLKFEKNG